MQIFDVTRVSAPTERQIRQTDKPLFNVGERMEASVVSTDGRNVKLELKDGSTLDAARSSSEVMRPGDTVTLTVTESTTSSAQLKLTEVNGQPVMPEITREQAALMRVSYAPTASAASDMQLLSKLLIPASTTALSRLALVRQSAPTLGAERAALFASTDIPVTTANIKAFDAWISAPTSASALADTLNAFASNDPQAAKAALEAFASAMTANASSSAAPSQAQGAVAQGETLQNANATAQGSVPQEGVLQEGVGQNVAPQSVVPQNVAAQGDIGQVQAQGASGEAAFVQEMQQSGTAQESASTAQATLGNAPASSGVTAQSSAAALNIAANRVISASSRVFNAANGLTNSAPDTVRGELSSSPPLRRILSELFLKLSDADSAAAARGAAVKEAVTRLPESVARLSGALGEAAARSQAAVEPFQASASLASQLSMGAELGSMLYTQIPLRNDDSHSTADLYILKRDRGTKNIDDANATVAICIETENLGRVESLLHIEKNDLTLRFRVETEREARFIKDRLDTLRAMDFPAQYRLRGVSVALADEPLSLNNAARTLQKAFNMPNTAKGLDIQV